MYKDSPFYPYMKPCPSGPSPRSHSARLCDVKVMGGAVAPSTLHLPICAPIRARASVNAPSVRSPRPIRVTYVETGK